jgi:DNA-binding MarR family transcriptional regulator
MSSPCNCLYLRQATRRVTQLYDRALAPLDLRATQYALLREIERHEPVALHPLAEAMVMDRATLGHNIRPLEARGLIRVAVGKDRRSREVSLTAAGRKMIVEARKHWRRAQRIFEREIGGETAATMRSLLGLVAATEFPLRL